MNQTTAHLILAFSIAGTSISLITLFGGGFLLWKARNDMQAAKSKAEQYRREFEAFIARLKTL